MASSCPTSARRRRWRAGGSSWPRGWATTGPAATGRTGDGTSGLSAHLKYGEIHPRTLLADLAGRRRRRVGADASAPSWPGGSSTPTCCGTGRSRPGSIPAAAGRHGVVAAGGARSRPGRRGAPASRSSTPGMRQLRAEGWMHNRVRMVVASFLVKDLHVEWQHGARHFMRWLRDGDLASNSHGWQWAAGSGTDAAPYVRVFNPVTQGLRFDPDGDYVRRYVPGAAAPGGPGGAQAVGRRGRLRRRLSRAGRRPRRRAPGVAGPLRRDPPLTSTASPLRRTGSGVRTRSEHDGHVRHVRGPSVRLSPPCARDP